MRAEELRIGNWVTVLSSVPTQVSAYHLFQMVSYNPKDPDEANYQEITNPIPLTEEWLLRFGFERVEHDERDWYKYPLGLINPMHSWEDKFYMMSGDQDLDVKYVHQLQNLYYALTNKEL